MHTFGCNKTINPFKMMITPIKTPQVTHPYKEFNRINTPKTKTPQPIQPQQEPVEQVLASIFFFTIFITSLTTTFSNHWTSPDRNIQ